MNEKRLNLKIEEDDIIFLDDLKRYFGSNMQIEKERSFSDPEALLTIGISLVSLTMQAIDFICAKISDKVDTEEQKKRCVVDPSGRIELQNYSLEEIKEIIMLVIQEIRDEK